MADVALVALAFASSYLGFALFALTQKPHHMAVSASTSRAALPRSAQRRCFALGVSALALSFAASLGAEGASFGSIVWVLALGCAALGVMFTLTYRPEWLRALQRTIAR
jgi:Na+/H+-dicarboxylate symporter